jgi:hypothetical protein
VYFLATAGRKPTVCEEGKPLTWAAPGLSVYKWNATDGPDVTWNFAEWRADPPTSGTRYALGAEEGVLTSTQASGAIY